MPNEIKMNKNNSQVSMNLLKPYPGHPGQNIPVSTSDLYLQIICWQ